MRQKLAPILDGLLAVKLIVTSRSARHIRLSLRGKADDGRVRVQPRAGPKLRQIGTLLLYEYWVGSPRTICPWRGNAHLLVSREGRRWRWTALRPEGAGVGGSFTLIRSQAIGAQPSSRSSGSDLKNSGKYGSEAEILPITKMLRLRRAWGSRRIINDLSLVTVGYGCC